MSTQSNKLEIQDLPVECVAEILKCLRKVPDKNDARLVCKLWLELLNADSSRERYRVDSSKVKAATKSISCYRIPYFRSNSKKRIPNFRSVIPLFLKFQRKKVTLYFEEVELKNSKQFWIQKGADVLNVHFGMHCSNIPLIEVTKYCTRMQSLTIDIYASDADFKERVKKLCEKRVADEKSYTNSSVNNLAFRHVNLKDVVDVTQTFTAIFPQTKNVTFEYLAMDKVNIDWPSQLKSLCDSLKDHKTKIRLSQQRFGSGTNAFIFDTSLGNVSVKVKSIISSGELDDERYLSKHLAQYPCKGRYLAHLWLSLDLVARSNESFKFDRVEEIVLQCPSLEYVCIRLLKTCPITPLTKQLCKHNVRHIELRVTDIVETCIVNQPFMQSFANLKTFFSEELSHDDFVKLLNHFECLEEITVRNSVVSADKEANSDTEEVTTVSNGRLNKLAIPRAYLLEVPAANYVFNNLKQLAVTESFPLREEEVPSLYLDHNLKRVVCPKLQNLCFMNNWEFRELNQDECGKIVMNILSNYPTLMEISLYTLHTVPISDQCKKIIRQTYPRLRKVNLP